MEIKKTSKEGKIISAFRERNKIKDDETAAKIMIDLVQRNHMWR